MSPSLFLVSARQHKGGAISRTARLSASPGRKLRRPAVLAVAAQGPNRNLAAAAPAPRQQAGFGIRGRLPRLCLPGPAARMQGKGCRSGGWECRPAADVAAGCGRCLNDGQPAVPVSRPSRAGDRSCRWQNSGFVSQCWFLHAQARAVAAQTQH